MADNELRIKLKAIDELTPVMVRALEELKKNTQKATDALEKIAPATDRVKKSTEELNGKAVTLSTVFLAVKEAASLATSAFEKVGEHLRYAINEALEAEKTQNLLTGALVSSGQYTREYVASLDKYVKTTEAATGVSGELIQTNIALGIQMGLSVKQATKMEEAARKLAVVNGGDVAGSFALLQGALAGQTRGLSKILPQIKELTEAQLKNGAAIDVVNQALSAQYNIYEKSFAVAVTKAKNSLSNVYEEIGKIIIQNPVVIKAVESFAKYMDGLKVSVEQAGKWIADNQQRIEDWIQTALTMGKAAVYITGVLGALWASYKIGVAANVAYQAVLGAVRLSQALYAATLTTTATASKAAAVGTQLLTYAKGALAIVMGTVRTAVMALWTALGPVGLAVIGLTTAAVAAYAAFQKWPGLMDIVVGSLKTLLGIALFPVTAALAGMLVGIGALAKAMKQSWGASVEDAGRALVNFNKSLIDSGVAQARAGVQSIKNQAATEAATKATQENTEAIDANLAAQSRDNAVKREAQMMFGGYAIGTLKQREALEAEKQGRDRDIKEFERWLESKKRLAISKADEERAALNAVRAKSLTGSGSVGVVANSRVEIDNENKKQAELAFERQKGILSEEQYNAALLASQQRRYAAEVTAANAQRVAKADALGESEAGYQLKLKVEEDRYAQELKTREERALAEGASDLEIRSLKEQAELEHKARLAKIGEDYFESQAKLQEQSGNSWGAMLTRMEGAYKKHGSALAAAQILANSEQVKATQGMLANVAALRGSHSRKAFEIGQKAAIADATVSTIRGSIDAYMGMIKVFPGPPGIALGIAAAASTLASGYVSIQKIASQKYEGGQADQGMDSIPASLSGKSFILSQGERVVQPEANKDLTAFLQTQKQGGSVGGPTFNLTVHYSGSGSEQDARKLAEVLVKEIRAMSERGVPVVSSRGVVQS